MATSRRAQQSTGAVLYHAGHALVVGGGTSNPETQGEDDPMHTVLRKVEGGKANWNFNDTYKPIGDHPGPVGNLYVAITNLCTIVRR